MNVRSDGVVQIVISGKYNKIDLVPLNSTL